MFFKRKERWHSYPKTMPPIGEEVLFCDYYKIFIGKVVNYKSNKDFFIVLSKNEEFGWEWQFHTHKPIFWRYLPNKPERKNEQE